jgi:integrase
MGFIRMARPARRKRSTHIQFRQRIPLDVLAQMRGRVLTIPVGADVVTVRVSAAAKELYLSLRTRDPAEAKARHAEVGALLANLYRSLRDATPLQLTPKQSVALSGDLFRAWEAMPLPERIQEAHPGEDWTELGLDVGEAEPRSAIQRVIEGEHHGWRKLIESGRASEVVAPFVDRALMKRGLPLDGPSRGMVLAEFVRAADDACAKQARNARGDFTPDATDQRFLAWQAVAPPANVPGQSLTFDVLLTRWQKAREPAPSSVAAFENAIASLRSHLGHDDPRSVTKADIRGWRDVLREGRTAKTVNEGYLALVRTLYRLAIADELLSFDPVQGVRDERKQKAGNGGLAYDDDEVAAILSLADAETKGPLHWIPWLLAFTGARVGEIAQLWGKHVKCIDGVHVLSITPTDDGGTLKNIGSERDVPLHPAIIERGFLEFVKERGGGPLFYGGKSATPRPRKPNAKRHAAKGPANRVREWIRENGFDNPRKAPNHAFRHWFKSVCPEFGIFDSQANQLQGHAGGDGEADKYRHRRLKALYAAMCKLDVPRTAKT